jgi:DNA polymerase III gamma/tau subunit
MLTAPASGETLLVLRNVPLTQQTDYQANDPFPAETHEEALDKLTMLTQQLQDGVNRSIKLSRTNTITSSEFSVGAADRANKILAFDSAGEIAVTQEIGTYRGNWASGTAYQKRDLIKDTSNANIYICLVAHTASGSQPISSNADVAKWALIVDAAAAASSAAAAAASAAAAALSETAAETAETNAETAQTAAEAAQTAAEAAQAAAELAETNAETAETNAETAETNAETAQAAAEAAQAAAEAAQLAAEAAQSAAETAETNAETAETNAAASAAAALVSEGNAATSETNAANSASAAQTAETNAETAETNAETAQTAAEAAQAAAEAALASFNATYLGAQASDPSLDNEGDPVTAGDWYFNTSSNISRIYDGASWANVTVSAATVVAKTSSTGSAVLPTGTDAQRDGSPAAGYIRFNTDQGSFEGYNGSAWSSVGGGATGGGSDAVFIENDQTVTANYTIPSGRNAMSTGPVTIDSGVTVTVSSGSRYVVI